eukprot:TRINITY_DN2911_c0_g1_i11.p1 TRINITY_DN2911_c0_g1~~TRINITY_DN2911_c0_g1_i11.p1  ORF type:complete len:1566 (+),score=363.64 TRINITY_DN2911_c0_g1_i11:508-4698(+)
MMMNTHYFKDGWANDQITPKHYKNPGGVGNSEEFAVYGVWWKDSRNIVWYRDGKPTAEVTLPYDFNEPMYMFFDMEAFSWGPGFPDNAHLANFEKSSAYYDWVHTYQLASGSATTPSPTPTPTAPPVTPVPTSQPATSGVVDIPGRFEAEAYSSMSGVRTTSSGDIGGGLLVGWIDEGDWMEYDARVSVARWYPIVLRVASMESGGYVTLFTHGTNRIATASIPNTGGWKKWTEVRTRAYLRPGKHNIRIRSDGKSYNLNWFTVGDVPSAQPVSTPTPPVSTPTPPARTPSPPASTPVPPAVTDTPQSQGPCQCQGAAPIALVATSAFEQLSVAGFAPAYVDGGRKAVAIDAARHKGKFAAASTTFSGPTGVYDVVLGTLTETDGESSYRVAVNGKKLSLKQNPETSTDYTAHKLEWRRVQVSTGDRIQIEFSSHTNGKIPEGSGTAYSRGRWTEVVFTCVSTCGGGAPTAQPVAPVDPVMVEAEAYSKMQGVKTQATTDNGGGQNVGWIDSGDWMEYTVTVASAGTYDFSLRVATIHFGAELSITRGGARIAFATVPKTGGWQTWTTVVTSGELEAGENVIRITSEDAAGWNINWFSVVLQGTNPGPGGAVTDAPCTGGSAFVEQDGYLVVEAEDTEMASGWQVADAFSEEALGKGHVVYSGPNHMRSQDSTTTLKYAIQITNPGTYQFRWRSRNGKSAAAADAENDSWLKIEADDYYGVLGTERVPIGNHYAKVWIQSMNQWSWNCRGEHAGKNGFSIFATFNKAGPYSVAISARSKGHVIDRFALYRVGKGSVATSDSTASTKIGGCAQPGGSPTPTPPTQGGGSGAVQISGESMQWHKQTLSLEGPLGSEDAQTFLNYRMDVTFKNGGETLVVPGYFAADGNAKDTSATTGNVWRAHLSPSKAGTWSYEISFRRGSNVAVGARGAGSPVSPYDGTTGTFQIGASDKSGRDFRAAKNGRLLVTGARNLKFAGSERYFVKAGADSPETLLAFADFDGTSAGKAGLKTWGPHVRDWKAGDPTWKGSKGKGLIGAVNYLANQGCNVMSFLTFNIRGDGDNVWMYSSKSTRSSMDVSKLDQWEVVFEHMTKRGVFMHFKTQETENDWLLDRGDTGRDRKLYYRELVARFSHHLALNWNLGEENTQSTSQQKAMTRYFEATDPYHHLVVLHTWTGQQEQRYRPLLGQKSEITGASIQTGWNNVHAETLKWIKESKNAGKQWVVSNDEQGSASIGIPAQGESKGPSRVQLRHNVLWGNLLAGGGGIESYFGYQTSNNDLNAQNFRVREDWWKYCAIALDFFNSDVMDGKFQDFSPCDSMTSVWNNWCLGSKGDTYVVYMPDGSRSGTMKFGADTTTYKLKWFNPRTGDYDRRTSLITARGTTSFGQAPSSDDWVAVLTK